MIYPVELRRDWARRPDWPYGINGASPQAVELDIWRPDRRLARAFGRMGGAIVNTTSFVDVGDPLFGLVSQDTATATSGDILTSTFPSISGLSISAWIYTTSVGAYRSILFARNAGAAMGLICSGGSGNPLTMQWNNSATEYNAATGLTIPLNEWALAVGAHSGTLTRLYLVGSSGLSSYDITTTDAAFTPSAWRFGGDTNSASYWRGKTGDMRVYRRFLTEADVWAQYLPRTRWDLYATPRRRAFVSISGEAPTFQAAWARGSNVLLQPGVVS